MKKILAIIMVLVIVFSLGACGQVNPKNDTDNSGDTSTDGNVEKVKNKTYFEVVYKEGLLAAFKYFDENYEEFTEDEKIVFVSELKKETLKRAKSYTYVDIYGNEKGEAPRTIENVDEFYPNVFDAKLYTFNINTLEGKGSEAFKILSEDDVFALCKTYWNTEGYVEDLGFSAVVKREVIDIIENRFDADNQEILDNINYYTDHVSGLDSKFESNAKYPKVLVENVEKISLFEGLDKVLIYLPVKIIDEPIITDSIDDSGNIDDSSDNNDNSNNDQNKSDSDSSENKNDEAKEDLPKDTVIKNYDGVGLDKLETVNYDYKYSEEFKEEIVKENRNLAIFGKIYDVEIGRIRLYTEGVKEVLARYDEIENSVINLLDCPIEQDDMSSYMLFISFYDEDLNQYTFGYSSDLEEKQLPFCELKKQELKSGAPEKVAFNSGEKAIINSVDGSDDKFTALYLVDAFEDFVNDDVTLMYYPCDSRAKYNMEEEYPTTLIPLFVSSNMYDVQVEYSNYGEVIENTSEYKNIKAGTWVIFDAILQGDGESYKITFKLKDGTEKEIYIGTDESDEAVLINGNVVNIK